MKHRYAPTHAQAEAREFAAALEAHAAARRLHVVSLAALAEEDARLRQRARDENLGDDDDSDRGR